MTHIDQSLRHVSYADAGVDIEEGARAVEAIKGVVAETNRPEVIGDLGGFGALFSVAHLKTMNEPVLVSATDGVGTKLAIAQLLNRHDTVGEDLVAMCVDDIVVSGAEPLFFLDYIATGKLDAQVVARIVTGIANGCKKSCCALIGGEMAEHPGVMDASDYDLAGFAVGVVDRPAMLGAQNVRAGDVILGLPSSGFHSNGYSLVRKVVIEGADIPELERPLAEHNGESLADALLAPTNIYAGALVRALKAGAPVHAMAHITGGGISENLNRVLPHTLDASVERGAVKASAADGFGGGPAWKVPWVIEHVVHAAQLTPDEAYQTFNMGVGMALICASHEVDACTDALRREGLVPFKMGEIIAGSGKVVYR